MNVQPRRHGWICAADPDEIANGYLPEGTRLQMMYLLAGALMTLALMTSWPGLMHFRQGDVPGWVAIVLLMAVAQLVYVVWLLSLPDWSTLRLGMVLSAACATAYACGLAIIIATPASRSMALGLGEIRSSAGLWSAFQCALLAATSYGFGRESSAWREEAGGPDDW